MIHIDDKYSLYHPEIVLLHKEGFNVGVSRFYSGKDSIITQREKTNKPILYIDNSVKESLALSAIYEFKKQMEALANWNEIIHLSKNKFSNKMSYLFTRILELIDLFEPDDDEKISIGSLKSMFLFLFSLKEFQRPKITLNENGTFQLNWKRDDDNLMTLRFKENDSLDYVIFKSSSYIDRPIIFNNTMSILDFRDYLITMNLKFHVL